MKRLFQILLVVGIVGCKNPTPGKTNSVPVTNSKKTSEVQGTLTIGPEVSEFVVCKDTLMYWIYDKTRKLEGLYHQKKGHNTRPYIPLYSELEVVKLPKANDGFAADYDGVMEVVRIITVAPLSGKNNCPAGDELVLKENALGGFSLQREMPINKMSLQQQFINREVVKTEAQQDGPDFYTFTVADEVVFMTSDTSEEKLYRIRIPGTSTVTDIYGVGIGTSVRILRAHRPDLKISTEHFHIYLYEEGSNIAYEVSAPPGPDKEHHSWKDIEDSRVVTMIWK